MREVAVRLVNQLVAMDRALTSLSLVLPEKNPDLDERWEVLKESWGDVAETQRELRKALDQEATRV